MAYDPSSTSASLQVLQRRESHSEALRIKRAKSFADKEAP